MMERGRHVWDMTVIWQRVGNRLTSTSVFRLENCRGEPVGRPYKA